MLWGAAGVKAVRRTLMKSSPDNIDHEIMYNNNLINKNNNKMISQ